MLFCYAKFDFNVLANALNNCGCKRGKGRREIETVREEAERAACVREAGACLLVF